MNRAMLLLVLVTACGDGPDDRSAIATSAASASVPDSGTVPATLLTADTATVDAPLSLPAQLYVEHDAVVFARSPGVVESVLVDLGHRVRARQVLATLERTDQTIALEQARQRYDNGRQRVERQRALKTAGVVTQADSEQVEFEYREAELSLRKSQREYDLTRIAAPFDGVVTSRTARIGRLVNSGDTLFQVTGLAPVLARVRVPESSAFGLSVGSTAQVTGARGETASARVIRASPVIDAASGTREVILQLAPGARLTPGSSVTVRLGSERRRVVTIPRSAVGPEGYALVWDDHRTTLRAVTLGSDLAGDRVEVVSGLAAGEQVVPSAP
ncbi:MAG TPA: efflux RND transporter periplasmic adaptor subunit [Gemmatimonadales bacterium]|nr:efflux RND transporter periplasmic adaptor subunit [Gemmatimonadales bacterium]